MEPGLWVRTEVITKEIVLNQTSMVIACRRKDLVLFAMTKTILS